MLELELKPAEAAAAGRAWSRRCLGAAGQERWDWYRLCERIWAEQAMAAAGRRPESELRNGEGSGRRKKRLGRR